MGSSAASRDVYARILSRVDTDELREQCCKIVQKDAKRVLKRFAEMESAMLRIKQVDDAAKLLLASEHKHSNQESKSASNQRMHEQIEEVGCVRERLSAAIDRLVTGRPSDANAKDTPKKEEVVPKSAPSWGNDASLEKKRKLDTPDHLHSSSDADTTASLMKSWQGSTEAATSKPDLYSQVSLPVKRARKVVETIDLTYSSSDEEPTKLEVPQSEFDDIRPPTCLDEAKKLWKSSTASQAHQFPFLAKKLRNHLFNQTQLSAVEIEEIGEALKIATSIGMSPFILRADSVLESLAIAIEKYVTLVGEIPANISKNVTEFTAFFLSTRSSSEAVGDPCIDRDAVIRVIVGQVWENGTVGGFRGFQSGIFDSESLGWQKCELVAPVDPRRQLIAERSKLQTFLRTRTLTETRVADADWSVHAKVLVGFKHADRLHRARADCVTCSHRIRRQKEREHTADQNLRGQHCRVFLTKQVETGAVLERRSKANVTVTPVDDEGRCIEVGHSAPFHGMDTAALLHSTLAMSGFERILARVGGDALRDYCSSAIEDELKNLKEKMRVCLASVEKALEVQDAILKLDVPLTDNAATFAAIQSGYQKFNDDLDKFIKEQKKMQAADAARKAEDEQSHSGSTKRRRTGSIASANGQKESPQEQEITRLLGRIQHRLTRKQNDTWIVKNIDDVGTIASLVKIKVPEKAQRKDLVLVLDHFASAVLLSAFATDSVLVQLSVMLANLVGVHNDIDDYIRSARELLASKRSAFAPSQHQAPPSYSYTNGATSQYTPAPVGIGIVDSHQFNSLNSVLVSDEPHPKKTKIEHNAVDLIVKVENAATSASSQPPGIFEVHVYDLPWGAKQSDVKSYFSGAGTIVSIRMPTMDDGSTVGVAIIRFATFTLTALLVQRHFASGRMDASSESGFKWILARLRDDLRQKHCSQALQEEIDDVLAQLTACSEAMAHAAQVEDAIASLQANQSGGNAAHVRIRTPSVMALLDELQALQSSCGDKLAVLLKPFMEMSKDAAMKQPHTEKASKNHIEAQEESSIYEEVGKAFLKIQKVVTKQRGSDWIAHAVELVRAAAKSYPDESAIQNLSSGDACKRAKKELKRSMLSGLEPLQAALLDNAAENRDEMLRFRKALKKLAKCNPYLHRFYGESEAVLTEKEQYLIAKEQHKAEKAAKEQRRAEKAAQEKRDAEEAAHKQRRAKRAAEEEWRAENEQQRADKAAQKKRKLSESNSATGVEAASAADSVPLIEVRQMMTQCFREVKELGSHFTLESFDTNLNRLAIAANSLSREFTCDDASSLTASLFRMVGYVEKITQPMRRRNQALRLETALKAMLAAKHLPISNRRRRLAQGYLKKCKQLAKVAKGGNQSHYEKTAKEKARPVSGDADKAKQAVNARASSKAPAQKATVKKDESAETKETEEVAPVKTHVRFKEQESRKLVASKSHVRFDD
ncbi:Pre-mrna splicing factor, partial [Globisporangium splendens]